MPLASWVLPPRSCSMPACNWAAPLCSWVRPLASVAAWLAMTAARLAAVAAFDVAPATPLDRSATALWAWLRAVATAAYCGSDLPVVMLWRADCALETAPAAVSAWPFRLVRAPLVLAVSAASCLNDG